MVDPQQPRHFLDILPDLGRRHALRQQREADVLPDVHVRIEREQLEDEGDVALAGAAHGDVLAVEQDAAAGRQLQPGDHPQRRRLAAARRPEHDEELAVGDDEIGILDRDERSKILLQVFDADLGHGYAGNFETTMNMTVPASMVMKE